MKCKACGNVIPSELLRKDSFTCPSCGRAYRRSTREDVPALGSRKQMAPNEREERSSGSARQADRSGVLLRITACAVVVALIISIVALVVGMRSKRVAASGQVRSIAIEGSKYITVPVDIPAQPNENYLVALDIDSSKVGVGIRKKTPTSFTLAMTNQSKDAQTVSVTWALVPCQLPAE